MPHIYIYTQNTSQRLHYVADFIQSQFEDLEFTLISELESIDSKTEKIIHYGNGNESSFFTIQDKGIVLVGSEKEPEIDYINHLPVLYKSVRDDCGFDIFKAVLWVLTFQTEIRVESNQKDKHGRVSAKNHLFAEKKKYKIPVVDYWIDHFINSLNKKFSLQIVRKKLYSFSIGIDIDQAWKYKNKSILKTYGGIVKAFFKINLAEVRQRIDVLLHNTRDPFDTFNLFDKLQLERDQLIYFILNGNNRDYDPNHSIHHREYKKLLLHLHSKHPLGIHPSYNSIEQAELIEKEKKELEELLTTISTHSIYQSRQHYLRIKIPDTILQLEKLGIREEYSMSFFDDTGFRTGTSHPFYFYDLIEDRITDIKINPVIAMDRTYLQYLKYTHDEVLSDFAQLILEVKKFQGHGHIIWHNSSFDFEGEWKGFQGLFEKIVVLLKN